MGFTTRRPLQDLRSDSAVPRTPTHLPAVFATAGRGVLLFTFTHNLTANLAAVISAAVASSANEVGAAAALGVSVSRLREVARRHNVRLPWRARPRARGGR